tara:strand:+ start:318 stop:485 length:168 start_codon:yes stop_codon:yes gene_type:complete
MFLVGVKTMRWLKFLMWKYFKKDPKIQTIDDFIFWDNKLFKEYKEDYDEDSDYLH